MKNLLKIRHTGIVTSNLQNSLFFYRDLLGFELKTDSREDSGFIDRVLNLQKSKLHTVKLAAPDGQMIELLDFDAQTEPMESFHVTTAGPTHFAIQVRDLETFCRELKKHDIPFLSEPTVSPDGGVKLAFCRAPEGTYIEIVEMLQ